MRLATPTTLVALIAGSALWLGCTSAPSEADLGASILKAAQTDPDVTLTEGEAACMADVLLKTDLSDTTLNGLVANFETPEVLEQEAELLEPLVAGAVQFCLTDSNS